MELEEAYKNILKEIESGNIKSLIFLARKETEVKIIIGEDNKMASTLMKAMYHNQFIENLVIFCAKNFEAYKKDIENIKQTSNK